MTAHTLQLLLSEFQSTVGFSIDLPDDYRGALEALCRYLDEHALRPPSDRRQRLIAHINAKFRFNRDPIAQLYTRAASRGVTFHYHHKNAIQSAFDMSDLSSFRRALREAVVPSDVSTELIGLFNPIEPRETLRRFSEEVKVPSKLRRAKGDRPIHREILLAALSAFVFSSADEKILHAYFDRSFSDHDYESSFWVQLRHMYPQMYTRERTLDIVILSNANTSHATTYIELRASVFAFIEASYAALNNHGHLAIWVDPLEIEGRNGQWEIASDAMLFAEKHDEVKLTKTYFRHKQIAASTLDYVPGVDTSQARLEIANEGFSYRDTFVCPPRPDASLGSEALLVIFQKNQRDETPIPCPACRSHDVQGNSYPSFGVRSWECRNLLCPDRSKYNRGKRYSFKALMMQEAIDDPRNEIPTESVRSWVKDVQPGRTIDDAVEMLVRHYSLVNDGVHIFGLYWNGRDLGRRIRSHPALGLQTSDAATAFFNSAWFARYITDAHDTGVAALPHSVVNIGAFHLIHGDARTELRLFPSDYFDGAVTSPPYYNAREYAKWENIYCYLHDMYRIATECYRVLKPGAPYLYNIFDYFDNERNIVFSAMGDKRLILSAYTIDLFRRAGFALRGSVTWDKGDIEGKRGFNAGNFSPYYQAPFNCWEHVLVFVKPTADSGQVASADLPAVLRAQPVMKMVNGSNTHGHTAPFPEDLPRLLNNLIPPHSRILDPFGGSGTTARALGNGHAEVVCIERDADYCALAERMFRSWQATRKASRAGEHTRQLGARQLALFVPEP